MSPIFPRFLGRAPAGPLAYHVTDTEPEIRQVRQKMWEKVAARKHQPLKVFESTFGSDGQEYMLFGDLDYEMKTGEKQSVSWAGNMVLEERDGKLRFKYYRVYIQR